MIFIETNIFGAAVAFLVGCGIAALNYALSRYLLKNRPALYPSTQIVRQLIQVVYLVLLLMLGEYTPWNEIWLLVGGCLGVTLPMLWFTYKLVKLNDSLQRKEEPSDG